MQFPEKIPIERIEQYHTHYLGHTSDEHQFWAYVTFVYTVLPKDVQGDWQDYRNEYAVLHLFDKDGNHMKTKHCLLGTTKQVTNILMYSKLEEMVAELGQIEYGDIQVRLFKTVIDGVTFGLVPDNNYPFINLDPYSTITFGEPWMEAILLKIDKLALTIAGDFQSKPPIILEAKL